MQNFMPDADPKERLMLLQDNAAKVEQTSYQKPLTPDELGILREDLADDCIKLNQMEEELSEIKGDYKTKMDPLKNANKERLTAIKTKQVTVNGTIFHIAEHERGFMVTYDGKGEYLGERKLRPEEKQGNVFAIGKVANS